jgi:hypothetical protein
VPSANGLRPLTVGGRHPTSWFLPTLGPAESGEKPRQPPPTSCGASNCRVPAGAVVDRGAGPAPGCCPAPPAARGRWRTWYTAPRPHGSTLVSAVAALGRGRAPMPSARPAPGHRSRSYAGCSNVDEGLPQPARGDSRGLRGRVVPHRRPRLHGRGRFLLHRRPEEGPHHPRCGCRKRHPCWSRPFDHRMEILPVSTFRDGRCGGFQDPSAASAIALQFAWPFSM